MLQSHSQRVEVLLILWWDDLIDLDDLGEVDYTQQRHLSQCSQGCKLVLE